MKTMTPFHNIERFLSDMFGFDTEATGRRHIYDAVKRRIKITMADNEDAYLEMLKSGSEELDILVEQIVVPETWFFRDRESYNFLRKHTVETRMTAGKRNVLRILSVPCSTGEEPYSIAMTLLEAGLPLDGIRIDAVDINRKSLESAKRAVYGGGSFRGEKKEFQDRYFTLAKEGYRLGNTVKGLVHFYNENFVKPNALAGHDPYHVVFCKNLLIYLNNDARNVVLANLDRLLLPEGVIFSGHSEMMTFLQYGFKPVKHSRSFACRRTECPEKIESVTSVPPLSAVTSFAAELPTETGHAVRVHLHREKQTPESVLARVRDLADRGRLDEAMKLCGQYLKEHSDCKEAYYLMGLICLALDSFASAEDFFQKALYLDPCYYEVLLHMSLLYEKRDDHTRASIFRERIRRVNNE